MTNAVNAAAEAAAAFEFEFKGHRFTCSVVPMGIGFLPRVTAHGGMHGGHELPVDTDPYATIPEARRHGEQQAVRWVNEQTGAGSTPSLPHSLP